jgi:misacylated tRNA(Ala) deacylase
MTQKIYLTDSYASQLRAKVTSVTTKSTDGRELWEIGLDSTIFYPGGGGQPFDTGTISSKETQYNVIKTIKQEEEIIHITDRQPLFSVGNDLDCKIDWDKRYMYMRYHTAIHVIGGILEGKYGALFTGGQIGFEKSHFDFDMPKLNRELAEQIMRESQEIIDKNLNIIVRTMSNEEAMKIPNLARTTPGQELLKKLSVVRIVEIEGFDFQMDGGTHVKNTKEIGRLVLSNFENKGTHRKRIEIKLG